MAADTSKKLKLELFFVAWHRLQGDAPSSACWRMWWECCGSGRRQGIQTFFERITISSSTSWFWDVLSNFCFLNRLKKLFNAWHNMGTSMPKSLVQTRDHFCLTPKAAEQSTHWWGSLVKRFEVIVDPLELGGCAKRRRIYILVIARKILRPEIDTNAKLEAVLKNTISQLKVKGPPPNAFLGKWWEGKKGMVWNIFIIFFYHGFGNLWCLAHPRQSLMFPRDHEMVQMDIATRMSKNKTGEEIDLTQRCLGLLINQSRDYFIYLKNTWQFPRHPKAYSHSRQPRPVKDRPRWPKKHWEFMLSKKVRGCSNVGSYI